jgi:hypothetical protein
VKNAARLHKFRICCMLYTVLTRVAKCVDVDGGVFDNVLY